MKNEVQPFGKNKGSYWIILMLLSMHQKPYFCEMIIPSIVWTICFGLFCAIIVIQLFYYGYFFLRLANFKISPKANTVEHPVSIVICARDEAHNLVKNLPGVLVQHYKSSHEVVLVNDNSSDESKYVIDEFKRSFKNLNMVELTQEALMITGKKFPLSMGIKSAKYIIKKGSRAIGGMHAIELC